MFPDYDTRHNLNTDKDRNIEMTLHGAKSKSQCIA